MSTDGQAWSSDDPGVVAAFEAAVAAEREHARKVTAAARELGKNLGALRSSGLFDGRYTLIGLKEDNKHDPPEGWVYLTTRKMLGPARGKAGEPAREWMASLQPRFPMFPLAVLGKYAGLPVNDILGNSKFSVPQLFTADATMWSRYRGEPGLWAGGPKTPGPLWVRRKLSEYFAAREASDLLTRPVSEVQLAAIAKTASHE